MCDSEENTATKGFDECCPEDFRSFLVEHDILEEFKAASKTVLFWEQVTRSDIIGAKLFIGGTIHWAEHPEVDWKKYHNLWMERNGWPQAGWGS